MASQGPHRGERHAREIDDGHDGGERGWWVVWDVVAEGQHEAGHAFVEDDAEEGSVVDAYCCEGALFERGTYIRRWRLSDGTASSWRRSEALMEASRYTYTGMPRWKERRSVR